MTEAGPRWKAGLRAWADAPPEPVDWRRGVMTLVCFFTCWLFGGLLLFAKGTTDGFGSWATWLGVVCVALGVAVGCGQPAGRPALSAVRGRPPAGVAGGGRGGGAGGGRRVPAAGRGAVGGGGGARAPRLRLNAFDERVPVRGAVRHADAARARRVFVRGGRVRPGARARRVRVRRAARRRAGRAGLPPLLRAPAEAPRG